LRHGEWASLEAAEGMVAYVRRDGPDRRAVVINFSEESRPLPPAVAHWPVEVVSDPRSAGPGWLSSDQALLLNPT
jgi:hypothetical protein